MGVLLPTRQGHKEDSDGCERPRAFVNAADQVFGDWVSDRLYRVDLELDEHFRGRRAMMDAWREADHETKMHILRLTREERWSRPND